MNKTTVYKIEVPAENIAQELANKIPLQTLLEAVEISKNILMNKYDVYIISDFQSELQVEIERALLGGRVPVLGSGNSTEIIGWLEKSGRDSLP